MNLISSNHHLNAVFQSFENQQKILTLLANALPIVLLLITFFVESHPPRVEIRLYKLWSIWVITFFGHSCHFLQNWSLIFNVILLQNLKSDTKYEPKSEAVEIFSWKMSNFWWNDCLKCLWPKIVISDFLCDIIPSRRRWRPYWQRPRRRYSWRTMPILHVLNIEEGVVYVKFYVRILHCLISRSQFCSNIISLFNRCFEVGCISFTVLKPYQMTSGVRKIEWFTGASCFAWLSSKSN